MKVSRRVSQSGFSLIELMVVIMIIVVLAGMIAAALPGIQTSINRKNTRNFIAELESGIERYQIDNGIYPLNPDPTSGESAGGDRQSIGYEGSKVLYKRLSGDFDTDGYVDDGEKIYVQKLDYNSNKKSERPRSIKAGENEYLVIDTFNSPVRYYAQAPNIKPEDRKTFNPTYDLWSIAGTNPSDSEVFSVQAKYITNWQSSN